MFGGESFSSATVTNSQKSTTEQNMELVRLDHTLTFCFVDQCGEER